MDQRIRQALFWPQGMLSEIDEHAARLARTDSDCVAAAWRAVRAEFLASAPESAPITGEAWLAHKHETKVGRAVELPSTVLDEIRAEALRRDRSLSWVAQQAWAAALPFIERMERERRMMT